MLSEICCKVSQEERREEMRGDGEEGEREEASLA